MLVILERGARSGGTCGSWLTFPPSSNMFYRGQVSQTDGCPHHSLGRPLVVSAQIAHFDSEFVFRKTWLVCKNVDYIEQFLRRLLVGAISMPPCNHFNLADNNGCGGFPTQGTQGTRGWAASPPFVSRHPPPPGADRLGQFGPGPSGALHALRFRPDMQIYIPLEWHTYIHWNEDVYSMTHQVVLSCPYDLYRRGTVSSLLTDTHTHTYTHTHSLSLSLIGNFHMVRGKRKPYFIVYNRRVIRHCLNTCFLLFLRHSFTHLW